MLDNNNIIIDSQESFAARLKLAIGERSQAKVSELTGVPKGSIGAYLKGQMPTARVLFNIADGLEVEARWLATGEGSPTQHMAGEIVFIPKYDVRLSAGAGAIETRSEQIGSLAFNTDYLSKLDARDGQGLIVVTASGDSMSPTIADGASVLLDTRSNHWVDGIWGFAIGDELRLKRLHKGVDYIDIISDNPKYSPERLIGDDMNRITLIGRVRWVGQSL